jgi:protein-S-isoprenylcysteine O-methyltransferase Ste14
MLGSQLIILFAVFGYGLVHSLLASSGAKRRARKWFGSGVDRWYRLAYNFFGTITFLPVLGLVAALPDSRIYVVPAPWAYLMVAGQLAAVVVLAVGVAQTGIWTFLGIRQIVGTNSEDAPRLVTGGLYRWVRHPLYTAGLAFIWLAQVMTGNLLALNLGLTLYLVVGALYEERKLVRVFGDAYLRYRERTPMLIPGLIRWMAGKLNG